MRDPREKLGVYHEKGTVFLQKTDSVMDLQGVDEDKEQATFVSCFDDTHEVYRTLSVPMQDWVSHGIVFYDWFDPEGGYAGSNVNKAGLFEKCPESLCPLDVFMMNLYQNSPTPAPKAPTTVISAFISTCRDFGIDPKKNFPLDPEGSYSEETS